MLTTDITPEALAAEVLDTTPLVIYFLRSYVRKQTKSASTIPQVRVLAFLKRYPGASLSEVADALGVTNATASTLVNRLVQRGLVARAEDPKERRCVILKVTKAGEEQFQEVRQMAINEVCRLMIDLPPQKLKKIHDGLALLKDVFSTNGTNGSDKTR